MPERRGYLDRLVDVVPLRRGRVARVPRQLAWEPTRPGPVEDVDGVEPEPQRSRPAPPPPGASVAAPRPPQVDVAEHPPVQRPARAPLHVVVEPNAREDAARHEPSIVNSEALRPKAMPLTHAPAASRSQTPVPAQAPSPHAGAMKPMPSAGAPRDPVSATLPMPPAVTSAFERLSALSVPVPQPPPPAAALPAVAPAEAPARPSADRRGQEQKRIAVRAALATRHVEQSYTEPQVRIGTIEVTVLPPPPVPPAPVAPTSAPVVQASPAPVARLSRPPARYGFGQG